MSIPKVIKDTLYPRLLKILEKDFKSTYKVEEINEIPEENMANIVVRIPSRREDEATDHQDEYIGVITPSWRDGEAGIAITFRVLDEINVGEDNEDLIQYFEQLFDVDEAYGKFYYCDTTDSFMYTFITPDIFIKEELTYFTRGKGLNHMLEIALDEVHCITHFFFEELLPDCIILEDEEDKEPILPVN